MDYARWGRRLQFPPCFLPAGMHEAYPVREKLDLEQFQSHLLLLGCSGRNQLSFEAECNEQQVATLTSGSGWIHDAAMPKAHAPRPPRGSHLSCAVSQHTPPPPLV